MDIAKVEVYHGVRSQVAHLLFPASQDFPLTAATITKCKDFVLRYAIEPAIMKPNKDLVLTSAVKVAHIREKMDSFLVWLDFIKADAEVTSKKDASNNFLGLLVDGELFKINMNSNVTLKSCRLYRTSGKIEVVLTKSANDFNAPAISINKLVQFKEDQYDDASGAGLADMFYGDFMQIKLGRVLGSTLSAEDLQMLEMFEMTQLIFARAYEKRKGILISACTRGLVACILFHGLYWHHATGSNGTQTPIIDASFEFFPADDTPIFEEINESLARASKGTIKILAIADYLLKPMKQLFAHYHKNSVVKDTHPHTIKYGGEHVLKRCAIHPLYRLNCGHPFDENIESRTKWNAFRAKARKNVIDIENGNLFGIEKIISKLSSQNSVFDNPQLHEVLPTS